MKLNKRIGNIEDFRKRFIRGKPFRHIVISDFLENNDAKKVAEALKKEKFEEKDSDLFQFRQTGNLKFSRSAKIREFYEFMASDGRRFVSEISGIKLNGGVDIAGSLYIDTDYLLCHDDRLQGRKIAYVFYLCKDFIEADGGALAFLEDLNGKPGKVRGRHFPKWNSLMLFEVSKKSWHEVEEVIGKKKRYALGGWIH